MRLVEALDHYINEGIDTSEVVVVDYTVWFEENDAYGISKEEVLEWFEEEINRQDRPEVDIRVVDNGLGMTQVGSHWQRDRRIEAEVWDAQPIELLFPIDVSSSNLPESLTLNYKLDEPDWDELSPSQVRSSAFYLDTNVDVTWSLSSYKERNSGELSALYEVV